MSEVIQRLTDYYTVRLKRSPDAIGYHTYEQGRWTPVSWRAFGVQVARVAGGLAALDVAPGERLGVMAPSGLSWEVFQVAGLQRGAAIVGLDAHDQATRLYEMIRASELTGLLVSDAAAFERIPQAATNDLRFVVTLSEEPAPASLNARWISFAALMASGDTSAQQNTDLARPESIATIIFTSGSTGAPKGIAYTHRQICLAVESILAAFPQISPADRLVCWLPLSNLFQRMINFCSAGRGAQTFFVADPRSVMTHLPAIKPQVFIAVPRFFEKLYDGIDERLAMQPPWARRLAAWALDVGAGRAARQRRGERATPQQRLAYEIADRLVLRRLRAVMGGQIRFMISGSAHCSDWLLERFHAMGLLILEAYGLSENVVPIAINRLADYRFGSVGRIAAGNEVRIADDGEVLVRGAGVFHGYLDAADADPGLNAAGFLHTGDLGAFDDDGYLSLVGRKSDVFKTSTGRKVAPSAVEARLKQIQGVDHAVVFGAERKAIVALITPTPELAAELRDDDGFHTFAQRTATAIKDVFASDPDYLRPVGLAVLRRSLSIDSGELTSNLKLRRSTIEERHQVALQALFKRTENAIASTEFAELVTADTLIRNC